jgi:2-dehydropantoate 2-reductase
MVNGMGIAERLRMLLPQPLYLGSTTTACHRTSINTLNQIAPGATSIGPAGEEPVLPDWSLWTAAIPHLSWRTDIEQVLLEKLAINSAINPLTALHDIPNGVLLKAPYRALFDAVIGEISALLEHANSPYQQGSDLGEVIRTVAKQTAGNTSSMRADYQQGKPTEIEAILGYLVEHFAASLGSPPPTPILGELFNAIRAYERSLSAASPTPHPHQPKK